MTIRLHVLLIAFVKTVSYCRVFDIIQRCFSCNDFGADPNANTIYNVVHKCAGTRTKSVFNAPRCVTARRSGGKSCIISREARRRLQVPPERTSFANLDAIIKACKTALPTSPTYLRYTALKAERSRLPRVRAGADPVDEYTVSECFDRFRQ